MESSASIWQHLLLIAGVFLCVVVCAFALIALYGLLAHANRRKALRRVRHTQGLCDAKESAPESMKYKK